MQHIHSIYAFFIALTFSALASCSDGEQPDDVTSKDSPVSFAAIDKQPDAKASQTESSAASATDYFQADDALGVFAYYNGSATPDFMNNQKIVYNGTQWTYAPLKYWPKAGKMDFYGYYPHDAAYKNFTITQENGRPTLSYSNTDFNYDLMVADKVELDCAEAKTVTLNFRHLLAKITFTFTFTNSDNTVVYEPVIHMVEFGNMPYSGTFHYDFATDGTPQWASINTTATAPVKRRTTDPNGVVIANGKKQITDFDTYLFPGSTMSGEFKVSINNKIYTYTLPQESEFTVGMGKKYNLNFNITNNKAGNFFIATFSMWEQGDDVTGKLQ